MLRRAIDKNEEIMPATAPRHTPFNATVEDGTMEGRWGWSWGAWVVCGRRGVPLLLPLEVGRCHCGWVVAIRDS